VAIWTREGRGTGREPGRDSERETIAQCKCVARIEPLPGKIKQRYPPIPEHKSNISFSSFSSSPPSYLHEPDVLRHGMVKQVGIPHKQETFLPLFLLLLPCREDARESM
jgi:hypothetical protein